MLVGYVFESLDDHKVEAQKKALAEAKKEVRRIEKEIEKFLAASEQKEPKDTKPTSRSP